MSATLVILRPAI